MANKPKEDITDDDFVLESVIIGDKRSKLGRRLGISSVALLLLFFAISAYIQSAENGRLLRRAAEDRSDLVDSVTSLSKSNNRQTKQINRLQEALRIQNRLLREAGIRTVIIPPGQRPVISQEDPSGGTPNQNSNSQREPREEQPEPDPEPRPNPPPTPDQLPGGDVRARVCELTGICP